MILVWPESYLILVWPGKLLDFSVEMFYLEISVGLDPGPQRPPNTLGTPPLPLIRSVPGPREAAFFPRSPLAEVGTGARSLDGVAEGRRVGRPGWWCGADRGRVARGRAGLPRGIPKPA